MVRLCVATGGAFHEVVVDGDWGGTSKMASLTRQGPWWAWLGGKDLSLSKWLSLHFSSLGFITWELDSKSKHSKQ